MMVPRRWGGKPALWMQQGLPPFVVAKPSRSLNDAVRVTITRAEPDLHGQAIRRDFGSPAELRTEVGYPSI